MIESIYSHISMPELGQKEEILLKIFGLAEGQKGVRFPHISQSRNYLMKALPSIPKLQRDQRSTVRRKMSAMHTLAR